MAETDLPPEMDEEEWEEYEGDDDDDEDDDDEDIDAEAEEMARRLGAQLWQDIQASEPPQSQTQTQSQSQSQSQSQTPPSRKASIILTVKSILTLLEKDMQAHRTLAMTPLSTGQDSNVLDTLKGIVKENDIGRHLVRPLGATLVTLAHSDLLFGRLKIDGGRGGGEKRKREEESAPEKELKRPRLIPPTDLPIQIHTAVSHITAFFAGLTPLSQLGRIQAPLHQIYSFAVSSSSRPSPGNSVQTETLQELGGLIQVLGVLSSTQIISPYQTAVFPCLSTSCPPSKVFSTHSTLRAHQTASHSSTGVPYKPHTCGTCSASFARTHDLKRHMRSHENKAWKCLGCDKIFSRPDALKRHQTAAGAGAGGCSGSEEVHVQPTEEEERRIRVQWALQDQEDDQDEPEEGELPAAMIASLQAHILPLRDVLKAHVAKASTPAAGDPRVLAGVASSSSAVVYPSPAPPVQSSFSDKELELALANATSQALAQTEESEEESEEEPQPEDESEYREITAEDLFGDHNNNDPDSEEDAEGDVDLDLVQDEEEDDDDDDDMEEVIV